MSPVALAPPDSLLAALRGTPALRPQVDRGLAGGLRAWLEDGIFERLGPARRAVVRLSTGTIAGAAPVAGTTALLRGALVAQLVRLQVAGVAVANPFADAVTLLRASGRDDDLAEVLECLDPEDRAQLASQVGAHHEVLDRVLPMVPARWFPRCGIRQAVPLAGGAVELRGLVDVSIGRPGGAQACVCLVEVTTSLLETRHERVLAYLALLETLRAGESPLRVAALSTADGTVVVRDVSAELLANAVDHVLTTLVDDEAA